MSIFDKFYELIRYFKESGPSDQLLFFVILLILYSLLLCYTIYMYHRGKIRTLKNERNELKKDRDRLKSEWDSIQERISQLEEIDANFWYDLAKGNPISPIPRFIPLEDRKTRFVSFINLKGGVGKTTLVVNLAAAYATGIIDQPLKVLVVDLDFQGTLSNRCAERNWLEMRRHHFDNDVLNLNTSNRLIDPNFTDNTPEDILHKIIVPMCNTNNYGNAIVSFDHLESADFRQLAQFVVQGEEVRFRHRRIFHSDFVFKEYDLVFFDCPPRITTSSINALTSSDFVVIPTSLHPEDTEAVPRTLSWLKKMKNIPTYEAKILAVILNRTYKSGTIDNLTKYERPIFELLQNRLTDYNIHEIMNDIIPNKSLIEKYAADSIPLGTTSEGHELYRAVAQNLYNRLWR